MAVEPLRFPAGRPPGGGGSDGTDIRLGKLEVAVDYVQRDVRDLKSGLERLSEDGARHLAKTNKVELDVAVLTERVSHLPTKAYLVATASTIVAFITAAIVFADKLRAVLGR